MRRKMEVEFHEIKRRCYILMLTYVVSAPDSTKQVYVWK